MPDPMTPAEALATLARLKEIEAGATEGPWGYLNDAQGPCMVMHPTLKGVAIANLDNAYLPANGMHSPTVLEPVPCPELLPEKWSFHASTYRPERVNNVRFIIECRASAIPALEALAAENERLREMLKEQPQ